MKRFDLMQPVRRLLVFAVTLGIGGLLAAAVVGPPVLRIGHFSAQSPSQAYPTGWEPIRFGDNASPTTYDLVRAESTVVVRARSTNGASGLITHQRVDLEKYPILEWRWRVHSIVAEGDLTKKARDDAAARLYVTFDYAGLGVLDQLRLMLLRSVGYEDVPTRALNYVWANRLSRGDMRLSPYTDQITMIPVRSGSTQVGQWVRERRNVLADYRRAFGEDPPPVAGVVIMTDTDNTGGTAQALYGDIVFRAAPSDQKTTTPMSSSPQSSSEDS